MADFTSGILVAAVGFDLDFRQVVTDRPKSPTEFNGQGQVDIAQADHVNGAVFSGSQGQSVLPVLLARLLSRRAIPSKESNRIFNGHTSKITENAPMLNTAKIAIFDLYSPILKNK